MLLPYGLGRKPTGRVQTLWVDLPAYCNLACTYCLANGGVPDRPEDLMTWEALEAVLIQAEQLGVDSIGIPGAGEPLLRRNRVSTIKFIEEATRCGIFVTLFTTAEFITEDLAKRLFDLSVELMIKCNSLDPVTQDRFVSDPTRGRTIRGYGAKRNTALETLMRVGFNTAWNRGDLHRASRLGLVTSIMTNTDGTVSNYEEIEEILRYCRRHNLILDCDTVLPQNRGATCDLRLTGEALQAKLVELQRLDADEFSVHWDISQNYIGASCDRCLHHLFIDQYGGIHPCIGAQGIDLGNVNHTMLYTAWNSEEMKIIRGRHYGGVCGTQCANFADGSCHSCLGRRALGITNASLLSKGYVETTGCWNLREKI